MNTKKEETSKIGLIDSRCRKKAELENTKKVKRMTGLWTLLKARIYFTPGKGWSSLANYTCTEEAVVLEAEEKGIQKRGKKKSLSQQGNASNAPLVGLMPCGCGPQENYLILDMVELLVPINGWLTWTLPCSSVQQLHVIDDEAQRKVIWLHNGLWAVLVKPLNEPGSLSPNPCQGDGLSVISSATQGVSKGPVSGRHCKCHHWISISMGCWLVCKHKTTLARCDLKKIGGYWGNFVSRATQNDLTQKFL